MVGTIETLLFAGDHYEANVRMASDVIQVHPSASGNWHEGQQVRLNLASEHLQIWAGTERTRCASNRVMPSSERVSSRACRPSCSRRAWALRSSSASLAQAPTTYASSARLGVMTLAPW